MIEQFDATDWNWIVGGDETRAWSSAAAEYVSPVPPTRVTRIASEAELNEVLAAYGLPGPDLASAKSAMKAAIDDAAERARMKYITPGAGMAMTYIEKFAQAQAVSALGEVAANALTEAERNAQFPTLSASVGIESQTLWDCAQTVLLKYVQFAEISRQIESARLAAKWAINGAADSRTAQSIVAGVVWPTP